MAVSTDGILVYGYNLGGGDDGWEIEELDEDSTLPWYDPEGDDEDFVEQALTVLRASVGFNDIPHDQPRPDNYYQRQTAADTLHGIHIETYCSGDSPKYLLSAKTITVARGHLTELNIPELLLGPTAGWPDKLAAALTTLAITPTQPKPMWLLASYWGC